MKMVLYIEFETADSLLEIGFSMWGTPYASHTHMSLEIRNYMNFLFFFLLAQS